MFSYLVTTMVLCASLSASADVVLNAAPDTGKDMIAADMPSVLSVDGASLKIAKLTISQNRFTVSVVRSDIAPMIYQGSLSVNEIGLVVAKVDSVAYETPADYIKTIESLFHRSIAQTNDKAVEEFNAARPDTDAMFKVQVKYAAPAWIQMNTKFIEVVESSVVWYMNGPATASEKALASKAL